MMKLWSYSQCDVLDISYHLGSVGVKRNALSFYVAYVELLLMNSFVRHDYCTLPFEWRVLNFLV